MKKIKVNGKEYPVRITMGALLRFKRETGKDVSEVSSGDVADMVILLWCCVVSACAADGVEFNLSLEAFADSLDPKSMETLNEEIEAAGTGGDTQKKTEGR